MNKILLVILLALSGQIFQSMGAEQPLYVFLGDSNLWIGGDDCSGDRAWSHELCRLKNARGVSFARSGATWTCTKSTCEDKQGFSKVLDDNNVIFNQLLRILDVDWETAYGKEPDIIFVGAGTNDAWFENRRPGIWDVSASDAWEMCEELADAPPSELTSLSKAIVQGLCLLAESFEESRIVIVGPPLTTACPEETIHKVTQCIRESLGELADSVTFVSLDSKDIIDPDTERSNPTYTSDGTHTNPEGAKKIAARVASEL